MTNNEIKIANAVGRMLAVCEKAEVAATGKSTTTDKLRTEAMGNPCTGLTKTLAYITQEAMPQLARKDENLAEKYNRRLCELSVLIGDSMPGRLTLEQQGAVQLGYWTEKSDK